jgi:hypothetical protein
MTVTLNLPPEVEQAYLAQAQAKGVALDDLVREVLIAMQPSLPSTKTISARARLVRQPGRRCVT